MAFCWVSEWIEDILHPTALSPSSSSHSHLPSRLTLANNCIGKSLTWCYVLLWVFLLSHFSLTASTYLCPTIACTLNSFKMSINTIKNIKHRIPSIRSQTSSRQASAWILQLLADRLPPKAASPFSDNSLTKESLSNTVVLLGLSLRLLRINLNLCDSLSVF